MKKFYQILRFALFLPICIVAFFPTLITGWLFQRKAASTKGTFGESWLTVSPLFICNGEGLRTLFKAQDNQIILKRKIKTTLLKLSQKALFEILLSRLKPLLIFLVKPLLIFLVNFAKKPIPLFHYWSYLSNLGAQVISTKSRSIIGIYETTSIDEKHQLMLQTALACGSTDKSEWWQFLSKNSFFSKNDLLYLMKNYVLRQNGAYTEFIKLTEKWSEVLSDPELKNDFNYELAVHFSEALQKIKNESLVKDHAFNTDRRKILIGVSVWGKHYVNIFTNYCLPSLLAAGNLPALCKSHQPILLIHTDIESKKILNECKVFEHLKKAGVCIYFRILDKNLTKRITEHPDNVYWHLGMVQSLDLFYAQSINADYHLLMPDTVYANNFFTGIVNATKNGTEALTRICYRATMEGMCPDLDKFVKGHVLSVPARKLAALGIRHIHPGFKSLFVTNTSTETHLPHVHVIIWEGENSLHLVSPHQTILFLDRSIVKRIPKRFFVTLDSELDKIIPEKCNHRCPNADDEMFLIEITSEKIAYSFDRHISIKEFCRRFWINSPSLSFLRFFEGNVIDELAREDIKDLNRTFKTEQEIATEKNRLRKAISSSFPKFEIENLEKACSIMKALKAKSQIRKQKRLAQMPIAELNRKKKEMLETSKISS